MNDYIINETPKGVQGLIIDIPGSDLTLFDLAYAVERLRLHDVPSDAHLKVWFDPECRREDGYTGPATRIRAAWLTGRSASSQNATSRGSTEADTDLGGTAHVAPGKARSTTRQWPWRGTRGLLIWRKRLKGKNDRHLERADHREQG
jgi:hypothetical protein